MIQPQHRAMPDNETEERPGKVADEIPSWEDGSHDYRAVHVKRGGARVSHLCLIPNKGTHDRYLPLADLRLMDVSKDGRQFVMEFSGHSVLVEGERLRTVASTIATGGAAAIEAFDPARRSKPDDPAARIIDSIRFFVPGPKEKKPVASPAAKPVLAVPSTPSA